MTAGAAAASVVDVAGREVSLPVVVRDATSTFATFVVDAAAARRLLPAGGAIELAEPFPGRALCSIAAVEYRDNDLGRYDEMAVALLVREPESAGRFAILDVVRGRVGAYIHALPVTTEFSCAAGRGIWGFPKIVAGIDLADAGGWRTATLRVGGTSVLELRVKRGGRLHFHGAALSAYAFRDGVLRKTAFVASGEDVGIRLGGATLELGDHPLATELRGLGLPRRPLASGWLGRLSARFEAPLIL